MKPARMSLAVPYLPIDQFESHYLEKFIEDLETGNRDWPDVESRGLTEYSEVCNEYSPFLDLVLQGMGMHKYAALFHQEDITLDVLVSMTDDDLKALGINDGEDRKCILQHLEQFKGRNEFSEQSDVMDFQIGEDDFIMIENVRKHMRVLNMCLSEIQSMLLKKTPDDYFICNFETGLKFFKFTINHALLQANRLSALLFGDQFSGINMITNTLNAAGVPLPSALREKLTRCHKKRRNLRKGRLVATVLIGIGIVVTIAVIKK